MSKKARIIGVCAKAMRLIVSALTVFLAPALLRAQENRGGASEVFAGSAFESYLRYVQTLEKKPSYPFGIRSFSPAELDRLATVAREYPWQKHYSFIGKPGPGFHWDVVSPVVTTSVNTAFPFGGNDGPVWKGKGLTTSIQMGIAARRGPFSAILAPVAFRAENMSIGLMPNGETGRLKFADGLFPTFIDRPQAFGNGPYSRVDLGESTIRVDIRGLAAGISTASQWWGPTSEFPAVLGNNAGGFPHFFLGTSRPAGIGLGTLHARVVYGFLDQSPWSPVTGSTHFKSFTETGTRRFTAGVVATMQPRGLPGFEIGGTRFFHAANPRGGLSSHNLLLPFQELFKTRLKVEVDTAFDNTRGVKENQLASLFVRIAPPGSGVDLYAEFAREDHAADFRDLVLEPDHSFYSSVGVRRAWLSAATMNALRIEIFTYDYPGGIQTRPEGQGATYTHVTLKQGHTERGQILAADVGPGSGDAQIIAFDHFTQSGRLTAFARRAVAHVTNDAYTGGTPLQKGVDVLNSVGAEASRFVGNMDVTLQGSVTLDMNRNFQSDMTNIGLGVSVRYGRAARN